jgi:outer membrane protein assembly factor BamB
VNGWHFSGGYDLATGHNLWTLDGGGDIPVPTPIFAHNLIYLTSAHGRFRPMRAIRPDASGNITPSDPDQTNAAIAWAHARQGNYMQTPIVVRNLLFACNDAGVLTCFDALTGEIKYSERLSKSGQGYTSSPVSDGRHLYFASEQGAVFVVPASDKFSVVASNDLHETCMATPAISDATIFYRTRTKLIAIGAVP